MSQPKHKSLHDLIEEARAIVITVSAAHYGAQATTEDPNFTFHPEISGNMLKQVNDLLLEAAGRSEVPM